MPLKPHPSGLTVAVRLTPNARKTVFNGYTLTADGGTALKISVNVPPEDGKANKALIAFLAKSWKLPKSSISLLSGAASRLKILLVGGDGQALMARISPLLPPDAET
ncbi:MAG: DUF167 domain-containing protein [Alphaproteobacteria bacterium]|nr:DUF167 domain-containing protein [Alphaproteobacteria bacterium]MDE2336956.1 DUF167 domain-containing protein [Alphaproteobacteria bacterium]